MSKMNFAMLLIGAGIGSAVTWFCVKKKYEQIAQEEIDSVRGMYHKKHDKDIDVDSDKTDNETEDDEMSEYKAQIEEMGYDVDDEVSANDGINAPYVIDIDDFGEDPAYDTATLYYYADGILADADDNIIDDIEAAVGDEALVLFDDDECDECVYVRNDRLGVEYEIAKDLRTYEEATRPAPRPRED